MIDELSAMDASEMSKNLARSLGLVRPLQRQSRWSLPLSAAVRLGRLAEASSIIDVASALNLVDRIDEDFFQDKFLQIVKMLYKLR